MITRHTGYSTEMDLRLRLRDACDTFSQREAAKRLGFSSQFINDVLHGRREVTEALATAMGYERVVLFQPTPQTTTTGRRVGQTKRRGAEVGAERA